MRSMGPLWALAFTLDRDLLYLLLSVNLLFAGLFVRLLLTDRRRVDQALLLVAVFTLLTAVSLVGLYLFARTPLREVTFFALE